MLQFSEFVWALRSSVWIVFKNFLLIDATDKSKISSDRKRLFFALRLYPLSFFANTPFKSHTKIGPECFSRFEVLGSIKTGDKTNVYLFYLEIIELDIVF